MTYLLYMLNPYAPFTFHGSLEAFRAQPAPTKGHLDDHHRRRGVAALLQSLFQRLGAAIEALAGSVVRLAAPYEVVRLEEAGLRVKR